VPLQTPAPASLPADDYKDDNDEDLCVVCVDNLREIMFLYCGHMVRVLPVQICEIGPVLDHQFGPRL